jgi:hypothetical protein
MEAPVDNPGPPGDCPLIPKGAQPAPPGSYIHRFVSLQAAKAEADDFVIYNNMWYMGGTTLGPLGHYQLDLIAKRLPKVPFPVVVATSKDPALDASRREIIVSLLAQCGMKDPTRVVVAYPTAEALYGEEAFRIYNQLLSLGNFGYGNFGNFGNFGGFGGGYGGLGGFGGLPGGGFNAFRGFGGFGGIGRP